MKYDYIVWDFNGTILDDVDLCLNILNIMLSERGIKTVTKEEYKEVFTFPVIDYYRQVGFDFEKDSFDALSVEFIELYQKASLKCDLCEGVTQALKYIKDSGYHQILLSASYKKNLDEQVDSLGIRPYFEHVFGIQDIQAATKLHVGLHFRQKVGDDAKVLMIGDSLHDAEVARGINADCILIASGHQSKKRLEKSLFKVVDTAVDIIKELD